MRRAEAAAGVKDYAVAMRSYARAARLLPWRMDLWDQAGVAAGLSGDFDTAINYLSHGSTHSERGWVVLAYAHFQKGNLPATLAAYQNGLKEFPSSATLNSGLAAYYRIQKDFTAERLALQNQILFNEENAQAHYRLGLLLSHLEPGAALAELTRAASLDPELAPAVETMRSALNIADTQTDESQKLVTIGRALGLVREWPLAFVTFQNAIEINAANAEAWAWLGEAEQQTGQDGSAALDQALSLDRESVIVRALRGLHWSRSGDYDRMLAEYSLAARIEPANPAWQAAMGDAHVKLGDLAAAIGFYQRAAELAPNEPTYWLLLAMLCAENGVAVEDVALPAAQKAAALAPNDPAAWDVLGFTYFSSGRHASAEETLQTAIELDPNFYAAYIHLALNYLTQGNNPAAYDALVYVRDHDVDGPHGERARELLTRYFP
jgi:tetratricopeptide (TPR) repeat protein